MGRTSDQAAGAFLHLWSLLALLLTLAAMAQWYFIPIHHDVAWSLFAAQRMLEGGRYVSDIFDMNPPLIYLLFMPGPALEKLLPLDSYQITVYWIGLLVLVSAVLWYPQLLRILQGKRRLAGWVTLGLALTLMLGPGFDFAQREHFIVILIMPWLVGFAGEDPAGASRVTVGSCLAMVFAALGFAIKPYYLLLPAALLFIQVVRRRSVAPLLDPHLAILTLTGLLYLGFAAVFHPEFFAMVKMTRETYFGLDQPVRNLFDHPLWVTVLVPAAAWFLPQLRPVRRVSLLLAAAGILAVIPYFIQLKGWSNHLLPVFLLLQASLMVMALEAIGRLGVTEDRRTVRFGLAGLLLLLVFLLTVHPSGGKHFFRSLGPEWRDNEVTQAIRTLAPGANLALFSTDIHLMMSLFYYSGGGLGQRWCTLSVVPGILKLRATGNQELADHYSRMIRRMMVEDLERYRPALVWVDIAQEKYRIGQGFDYIDFFMENPEFIKTWSHYTLLSSGPKWSVYVRRQFLNPLSS
ncbi:MAG: hypothetical protein HQL82_01440 [Magnetococcales bacterium]|nr:hypothetical protein [Magnetococcales bacterium]